MGERESEHPALWQLCEDLIALVAPDARWDKLAITKSFRGSPHVDAGDTTHQHVVAFDFTGGHLCAEGGGGDEELRIDVHDRVGRIDGRGVHWVSGWTGERFSVVWFSSSPGH